MTPCNRGPRDRLHRPSGLARAATRALVLLGAGCGTLAPDAGVGGLLPSSGIGPYRALASPSPLLSDLNASLDDALLVPQDDDEDQAVAEAFTLYFTRRDDAGAAAIARARFRAIDEEPEVTTVLTAEREVDGEGVSQPAVLRLGGRSLLVYATARGNLGMALLQGSEVTRLDGPALLPRPGGGPAGAGPRSSPALLQLDEDTVRLVFLQQGELRSADARAGDVLAGTPGAFQLAPEAITVEAPGEVAVPWREPGSLFTGRATARTVQLSTGRRRHDLLLTGAIGGARALGAASSFDGRRFLSSAEPLLDAKAPDEWAPSVASWRGASLLVYTRSLGRRTVIAAATRP